MKCENCGKEHDGSYGSGRFCSKKYAKSFSTKNSQGQLKEAKCIDCNKIIYINKRASDKRCRCEECKKKHKQNIKNIIKSNTNNKHIKKSYLNKCIICNNLFNIRHRITCSDKCHNIYLSNRKQYLSDTTLQKLSKVGKISVQKQSESRRSKNEIEFCKLCESYFNNVEHNKPIFNGWDADVIIHDIKYAILWNGKWHYEQITKSHSVKQVQNRDKIKIEEIKKYGYIPYIIKDMGKYKINFVKDKFNEFIEYLKENNHL